MNRGNLRAEVFHKPADFAAFLTMIDQVQETLPLRILALCLMPNHFHLVLWPRGDGDLSRWMDRLMNRHVRRYRSHYRTAGLGHVWQGRFKAFPVQRGPHLLGVLRYVEANPLRAGLVRRAEDWPWSSLGLRRAGGPGPGEAGELGPGDAGAELLTDWPVARPADWLARINRAQPEAELEGLRRSVNRGSPYGDERWAARTAAALGLEFTLRPRGRPRTKDKPRTARRP